ncbi:phosphatase PAP2 family protein [Bdellovibrio sp. HCB337]|uniref:phosphatase PAP2 family protein n=1 Tax=Bdellovibrio sp. HCB337 TaxID=3394358 RepID=UPI0039A58659
MTYPTRRILTVSILGFSLALIAALTLDQSVALYFKRPELQWIWLKARTITNVGLSEHYFVTVILLYIFAKWVRPQFMHLRIWARNFFFALIVSGVFVHIFKFVVGRQRPHKSVDFDPYVFHPFTTHWDFHSFVSGHTQVMFTVATMMSLAFPKARVVFLAIAAFFGLTRVIIHDHFLSDICGGAAVGYIGTMTAIYWVHLWLNRSSVRNDKELSARM